MKIQLVSTYTDHGGGEVYQSFVAQIVEGELSGLESEECATPRRKYFASRNGFATITRIIRGS